MMLTRAEAPVDGRGSSMVRELSSGELKEGWGEKKGGREGWGIEEMKEEKSSERKKARGNRKRPRGPRPLSGC